MKTSIGIRLDEEFIEKIDEMGKEEKLDRSTMIRRFLEAGYRDHLKRNAAKGYIKGELTISGAANAANITVWEMMIYLVNEGYTSEYSSKDLKGEIELLENV